MSLLCPDCELIVNECCENGWHGEPWPDDFTDHLEDWTTVTAFAEAVGVEREEAERFFRCASEIGYVQMYDNDITAVKYRLPKGEQCS